MKEKSKKPLCIIGTEYDQIKTLRIEFRGKGDTRSKERTMFLVSSIQMVSAFCMGSIHNMKMAYLPL